MLDREPGAEALLLGGLELRGGRAALLAFRNEGSEFRGILGQLRRQRMVRRDRDEARPKDGVGARSEDIDATGAIDELERAAQPLALADPVFLHQPDLL